MGHCLLGLGITNKKMGIGLEFRQKWAEKWDLGKTLAGQDPLKAILDLKYVTFQALFHWYMFSSCFVHWLSCVLVNFSVSSPSFLLLSGDLLGCHHNIVFIAVPSQGGVVGFNVQL